MGTATEATEARRRAVQAREHGACFACGATAPGGLRVSYATGPDGDVQAEWCGQVGDQSYAGVLHGGLIATLLDGAMVQALFARDVVARTAELRLRYRRPVQVEKTVRLRARLRRRFGPLYLLTAELRQDDAVCATAEGRFMAVTAGAS